MLQSWLKNFPFSYNLKKQKKYISSEIVKTLSEQKESAFILLKEARVPAEIIKILA